MSRIVLFGNGEYAEVAKFYFDRESPHDVVAVAVSGDRMEGDTAFGVPQVAFEEVQDAFPPATTGMFVAIAYSQVNRVRERFFNEAKAKGYRLVSYVSPQATCHGTVGENTFVFEDNTIQPFVRIGDNTVLWSGNHIGHHSRIGNHVFISSHCVISGGVTVEDYCFLGVNSTFRDHITIGESAVVGAGALIMKDVEPKAVYTTPRSKKFADDSSTIGL